MNTLRALLAIILFSLSSSTAALTISGRVLSDDGAALEGAEIKVGKATATTGPDGRFSLSPDPAEIYPLRFSAGDHYPMIHTFSTLDIERSATLPDVTLVPRREGRVMLMFGGDTMMGRRFSEPFPGEPVMIRPGHKREDIAALLEHVEPYLQLADYSSVNLETQIMESEPEAHAPKSVVFFTPPEALGVLRDVGVDHVTLGNNHTFDYLDAGLQSTIDALNASGLDWSGAGLNETDALQASLAEVNGHTLSFLGYVGWAGNFSPTQSALGADKGGAALGSSENIRRSVRAEAAQGYLPVVQYHGSREYTDEPTLVTENRLKQAIDDGAVVAIGHHPHVVQGFEIYKDRLVAYSMGNFLFDQYHYATKRSYMLFVWMDEDRLHRAEIVPIRLKGYVTTPATDSARDAVLMRVNELSARRGVHPVASGGHAMIIPGRGDEPTPVYQPPASGNTTVWSLDDRSWDQPVSEIDASGRIVLGQNLLPMGNLESHHHYDAPDRSWIDSGEQSVISLDGAPSGSRVMQVEVPAGGEGTFGMRTFDRTFKPGTPTTFVAQAWVNAPVTVTAYEQWRKRNQNREEALANAELRPIGRVKLSPGEWQEMRFDFDSPRVTAFAYRVVLKIEAQDSSQAATAWIDDIALIEWLSPPLESGELPDHVSAMQASHAGLVR